MCGVSELAGDLPEIGEIDPYLASHRHTISTLLLDGVDAKLIEQLGVYVSTVRFGEDIG